MNRRENLPRREEWEACLNGASQGCRALEFIASNNEDRGFKGEIEPEFDSPAARNKYLQDIDLLRSQCAAHQELHQNRYQNAEALGQLPCVAIMLAVAHSCSQNRDTPILQRRFANSSIYKTSKIISDNTK